eukprot:4063878-Amphidinium_carterae.1
MRSVSRVGFCQTASKPSIAWRACSIEFSMQRFEAIALIKREGSSCDKINDVCRSLWWQASEGHLSFLELMFMLAPFSPRWRGRGC